MMDIARTPSTADGNPELADAAIQPQSPPTILREDYAPFPWLVPTRSNATAANATGTRWTGTISS